MIKITNHQTEKKLTIAKIFDCDSTCILEDGRIAFCAWRDDKVVKKDFLLCFIIDDDGETNIEYIRTNTPATPCNIEITVD